VHTVVEEGSRKQRACGTFNPHELKYSNQTELLLCIEPKERRGLLLALLGLCKRSLQVHKGTIFVSVFNDYSSNIP
jgi:hypothetical protein